MPVLMDPMDCVAMLAIDQLSGMDVHYSTINVGVHAYAAIQVKASNIRTHKCVNRR